MDPNLPEGLATTVERRAAEDPEGRAFTFVREDLQVDATLTWAELWSRARAAARGIRTVAGPGDRVLLLHPPGLDYVVAFYGCLLAGVVAVPLYLPQTRTVPVVEGISRDCSAAAVVTTAAGLRRRSRFGPEAFVHGIPWIDADDEQLSAQFHAQTHDIGYLQYTSGSTSSPKGVVITRDNMAHQCAEMVHSWRLDPASRIVSWLPHFHDFGQVAGVLLPVVVGCPAVLMAPGAFVKRPARWLRALSEHRATHSAAPNFAFDLCVDATTADERAGLDLSTLVCLSNGAEPVRQETVERFEDTFARHGLAPGVVCPGYGLAEATLKVTVDEPGVPMAWDTFDPDDLARGVATPTADPDGRRLVACGAPVIDTEVAVVDPQRGERLPEGRIGEVWVAGPIVSPGYWARPDETAETFGHRLPGDDHGRYLRTGDLGFLSGGQLHLCGRIKDLVIVHGSNHHPQDIERTASASHPALRRGRAAVFAVDRDGRDEVVVVTEIGRHDETPYGEVVAAVRAAVSHDHRLAPTVVLVEAGAVPTTTSGKVQRRACRAQYQAGHLPARHIADAVPEQTVRAAPPGPGSAAEMLTAGLRLQVTAWLAEHAPGAPPDVDTGEPLSAHGLESVQTLSLHRMLEDWSGRHLPHEWMWESPSVDDLVARVVDRLTGPVPAAAPTAV